MSAPSVSSGISVGTYNVLFPQPKIITDAALKYISAVGYSYDHNGALIENWDYLRSKLIRQNIECTNLDVLCMQELTYHMCVKELDARGKNFIDWLKEKGYEFVWQCHFRVDVNGDPCFNSHGRASLQKHGIGIIYKTAKYIAKELRTGTFTEVNNDKILSRTHLSLDLISKTSMRQYRVVSCHLLDPRNLKNKRSNIKAIIDFAEKNLKSNMQVIIAGDMNQDQYGDIQSNEDEESSERLRETRPCTAFKEFEERGYHQDGDLSPTEIKRKEAQKYAAGDYIFKNRHVDVVWRKGEQPITCIFLPGEQYSVGGSDHLLKASFIHD